MTLSPGPPPWPIPPSWTLTTPPADPRPASPDGPSGPPPSADAAHRTIALLVPDGAGTRDGLGAVSGVTVDARPLPAPAPGFAGVHDLAAAAAGALGEGAHGVVIVYTGDAPEETAWALELLHQGGAPLVLAADPAGVADAIGVAAVAPDGCGCLLVAGGEVHAARHVHRSGHGFTSPEAGPMGRVSDGTVRLFWRPPERLTVRGPYDTASPRVGLYVLTLGEDAEPIVALARLCDGLVVAGSAVPEQLAPALAEAASRIPVVLASPAPTESAIPATTLDPRRARVLMRLLLAAGRDHESVLAAFTTATGHAAAEL